MGSGAVALNIAPQRALLADTNRHMIEFYQSLQNGSIDGRIMRDYLVKEGTLLLELGEAHYYFVRDRFNDAGSPLDFIFLSRSCFNGMMRFNKKGGFNVPFCRKPDRFRPALVTKIVNQVEWARRAISGKDWVFVVQDWQQTIAQAGKDDLIYCDPPYVGRHTDYYNGFEDRDSDELAKSLVSTQSNFALSNWLENKYRRNDYIDRWFSEFPQRNISHFYHVGASEELRNEMTEVVVLSHGAAAPVQIPTEPLPDYLPLFASAELFDV